MTAEEAAIFTGVMIFLVIILLITYVITAVFLSKLFSKTGVEGWKAWVPVYNTWVLLEVGKQPGWISLLPLINLIPIIGFFIGPIASIILTVYFAIAAYKIGLSFGKGGEFVLLAIFLPIVWIIWLALDKTAVWKDQKPAA